MATVGTDGVTNFWEIASLALSILQMILYILGFQKYCERLEELAEDLQDRAEERYEQYAMLRDRDPEFYDYYDALPDYNECESNIKRSKGSAFAYYGRDLRRTYRAVRGFNRLTNVTLTHHLAPESVFNSALHRATTRIAERGLVDKHVLQRWDAIVSTPIHIEGAASYSVQGQIQQSFSTLKSFGQGFNSAGAAFGTSLFRVLN